jgi:hypothetical protein
MSEPVLPRRGNENMALRTHVIATAMLAGIVLTGGVAAAQEDSLGPPPIGDVYGVAPAPPDACYRFGLRHWAKRTLFDKSGTCRCVKCGWHLSPPRRICWRIC